MGVSVAALVVYVIAAWVSPWRPGRAGGLTTGIMAALLFVNAAAYPARRRWQARPWQTVQQWLQLHVYGSAVAALLVLLHMGLRWPVGQFGWWLFALSLWTTASGALGVYLQKTLPRRLARGLRVEVIYERVPELLQQLLTRADAEAAGAAEGLERIYLAEWRPRLQAASPRWAYLADPQRECDRALTPLRDFAQYASGADQSRLERLEAIVREKFELDAHLSIQRGLRGWLILHVPPACVLMGLLGVHVIAVLLF